MAGADTGPFREPVRRGGRCRRQRGRAARRPDAAAHPGRGDRAAAPDRRGHAVPQADRQRRAHVAAAVGPARHRQDHAGLRRQPGDQAPFRGTVGGQRRGQGRAGGGRRRPPHAGPERHADRAVHRRSAPVLQDPAGRAAPGGGEPLGVVHRRDHGEPVLLGGLTAAVPVAAAHPAAAVRRRRARGHPAGPDTPARARRRGHAGRGRGRASRPAGRRRRAAGADLPGGGRARAAGRQEHRRGGAGARGGPGRGPLRPRRRPALRRDQRIHQVHAGQRRGRGARTTWPG